MVLTRSQSKKLKEKEKNTIIIKPNPIDNDSWNFDRRIDFCNTCWCYVIYYKNKHDCNNKILAEKYRIK